MKTPVFQVRSDAGFANFMHKIRLLESKRGSRDSAHPSHHNPVLSRSLFYPFTMGAIFGSVLSPIVSCSAPASRPLASSVNSSIQKYSVGRVQLPIVLDFQSDKGKQEIRNWYRKQPTTRFTRLEHRKDINGHFKHEFIAFYLDNSTICRFDRRAREDMRGHALKDEGTISEDSAHVITMVDTESRARLDESEVLMEANAGCVEDLEFILTVCSGIQSHPEANSYSLLHYNCYFFCWTLVASIDRQAYQLYGRSRWVRDRAKAKLTEWVRRMKISPPTKSKHIQTAWRIGLTLLGLSATSVYSSSKSMVPRVEDYICRGMEDAIIDNIPKDFAHALETMLFPTQVSSWLRRELLSAIQEGSRLGAQQFINVSRAYGRNTGRRNFREDIFDYNTLSVLSHQSLEDTRREAEKTWAKAYDEITHAFVADLFNDIEGVFIFSELVICWDGRPKTVQQHVTERMVDHFKQVESYGFGKAERSIIRAEGSITEIWESALKLSGNGND
ncbi:hypothetical protein V565_077340 [Rhizoctonia solani 123E]|uniref:Uncharacterized protein n=1 Tax=Rhizoctonia solani 123E TaxID=1423351 RepID=A0A074RUK3_9AGAM|nr:hypothetical protein V565_077340 [Rhizoctonia solani 123E]